MDGVNAEIAGIKYRRGSTCWSTRHKNFTAGSVLVIMGLNQLIDKYALLLSINWQGFKDMLR